MPPQSWHNSMKLSVVWHLQKLRLLDPDSIMAFFDATDVGLQMPPEVSDTKSDDLQLSAGLRRSEGEPRGSDLERASRDSSPRTASIYISLSLFINFSCCTGPYGALLQDVYGV